MRVTKNEILKRICYTELVYGRINKKLGVELTHDEIEKFMYRVIDDAHESDFETIGKNYYVSNYKENVKVTINKNTFRIITADKIEK